MEGQDFLTEYRNISNKLKKRFLRRPNVAEASDHFRQLAKKLEDNDDPQFAGFCYLATGRCEQTVGNSSAEVEAITLAARCFLRCELEQQNLKNPSYEEHLNAAIAGFKEAGKLEEEAGRGSAAAALYIELGDTLVSLQRSAEALFHYDKALELETSSIIDTLAIKTKISNCYISLGDHHNALKTLTELANFCAANDPCHLYQSQLANIEVLRVLLLLIIQPSHHNTAPHLLQVLDKYKWDGMEGEEEVELCPYLDTDISILLQSIVMVVQVRDSEALLYLEDEIAEYLNPQQKALLRKIVSREVKRK
ncbi:factor VIII intron 22 protein isoform X2 [Eurytemora carolleeae]|uniref:factor VIII intron 22 protein isoform X2 n=1 Tax=Eurytemora carolleeae TaxID=1294199 RepID=UPI000C76E64E|nr:factor VIII intron 22 protein isoform X2 [Eurytemora carolleeae]|eukprot:XP_023333312.1 factor VIII intron 22 protein-like isoform X2 [Eurytemora affinis]